MKKILVIFLGICSFSVLGQDKLPIIDMQLHAHPVDGQGPPPVAICTPIYPMPVWDPALEYSEVFMKMLKEPPCKNPVWSPRTDDELMNETFDVLEKNNIYGVLSGTVDRVAKWRSHKPERLYPAIEMTIGARTPSVDSLRALHKNGELMVLGELTTQYAGIYPNDERLTPYFELAEELDIPVGIHVGPGPPGVIYLGASNYRAKMHSPLTLENVLVKHPKLRLYIMHGGYPMLDDLLTVLYAHPQVYIDVGVIVFTQPREAFYRWLKAIVDAGFGNRVMFGSDQMVWPGVIERSIAVIQEAPFLTESQKRDIFYNNAVRFLRLSDEEIARHHSN
ncbi:amidohydrolase family protein [Gramella sp. KN1008]|uniref:amidohydrolase family protein n=1 Tax=Gramella sp. KN1008 TaxID=2529298 RepID=UPI00103C03BD|nr:amidohydrolase family protein [Gramella sp. KN1008]TBW25637.1 amidohydrolase [Gramella sp. KN1008]